MGLLCYAWGTAALNEESCSLRYQSALCGDAAFAIRSFQEANGGDGETVAEEAADLVDAAVAADKALEAGTTLLADRWETSVKAEESKLLQMPDLCPASENIMRRIIHSNQKVEHMLKDAHHLQDIGNHGKKIRARVNNIFFKANQEVARGKCWHEIARDLIPHTYATWRLSQEYDDKQGTTNNVATRLEDELGLDGTKI